MKALDRLAYSLLEIVIVIVILGVGAAAMITRFDNNAERVRAAGAVNTLKVLREAQEVYRQENGSYTADIDDLGVRIPPTFFFDSPQVSDSDADALASVGRNSARFTLGTAYTLQISQTGTVTCTGSGYCTSLGF